MQIKGESMYVTFGKHKGKSLEALVLKEPDYISWLLTQNATGPMLLAQNEVKALIAKFNKKPMKQKCNGKSCTSLATRITVYRDNVSPYWWCGNCDPYQTGALDGKLQVISDYVSALNHVDLYCGSKKSDFKKIIKEIAIGKGLPKRVGESQSQEFF